MKKFWIISGFLATVVAIISCGGPRRNPGRVYMPDMAYSRAYETYASTENLKEKNINYNAMPVKGTIARGDMSPYSIPEDKIGDTVNYAASKNVRNPLDIAAIDMKEAERLYLVNCGICHGTKLDGNGPLWKDGSGPYPAKPATLVGDPKYTAMTEGTMFHSVTYGKNLMGSYAAQLSTKQRWEVIAYIKSKQVPAAGAAQPADTTKVVKP
jgi:mono/diheme cytochrome c family protein